MTIEIRIPKLGMEMTEGTLARWLVGDGARIAQDQPMYLLETDKVETEMPAPVAGSAPPHRGRGGDLSGRRGHRRARTMTGVGAGDATGGAVGAVGVEPSAAGPAPDLS